MTRKARGADILAQAWDWVFYTSVNAVESAAAALGREYGLLPQGLLMEMSPAAGPVPETRTVHVAAAISITESDTSPSGLPGSPGTMKKRQAFSPVSAL